MRLSHCSAGCRLVIYPDDAQHAAIWLDHSTGPKTPPKLTKQSPILPHHSLLSQMLPRLISQHAPKAIQSDQVK